MFSRILSPVDLSHVERTVDMFNSIRALSGREHLEVTLLHVVPDVPSYISSQVPPDLLKSQLVDAMSSLNALARSSDLPGTVTTMVEQGNPFRVIIRVAGQMNADLIVIGSHRPGPSDYLLGSVASKVVRHSTGPVLVVR